MNLGRGFSIPQDRGFIGNQNPCIPLTPEKPIVQRSNALPPEMEMASSNWQDLVGIYTGVLQEEASNRSQQNFRPTSIVNHREYNNANVASIEVVGSITQNSGIGGSSHTQNFTPTGHLGHQNYGEHSNPSVAPIQKFRNFNQHALHGSYIRRSGNDIPQKVNSLVELLGANAPQNPLPNRTIPSPHSQVLNIRSPHSQVISSRTGYRHAGTALQQNHILCGNQNIGGYSQQPMPTDGYSVTYRPSYNLNLPPTIEPSASTSTVGLSELGPVTPNQQHKSKNCQYAGAPNLLIEEISSQEEDYQENVVLSQQPEIVEKQSDQSLQNIVYESIAPKENNTSDDGDQGGIDLNKTPQQKPPKRRKHRPKVVVEGKPKRTPKPATPKENNPNGNPSGKRKYVRRKETKTSTQLTDVVNEVGVSNVNSATKSCRRMLNFDLENGAEKESQCGAIGDQAKINEKRKSPFTWNLDSHIVEEHTGFNGESISLVKERHHNINGIEKQQQTENLASFLHSANHTPLQVSLPMPSSTPPSTAKDRTLNVIARSFSMRNANINQRGSQSWNSQFHHVGGEGVAQFVIETHTNERTVDEIRQPISQTHLHQDLPDFIDRRGSKREYPHTEFSQPETPILTGSQLLCHRVSQLDYHANESNKRWQDGLETSKRTKVEDKFHVTSSTTPSRISIGYSFRQVEGRGTNSIHANSSTLHLNGGLPYPCLEGRSTTRIPNSEAKNLPHDWIPANSRNEFQQQLTSSQVHSRAQQMVPKVNYPTNKAYSENSLAAILWNKESSPPRDPKFNQSEIINSSVHPSIMRQTARLASYNQAVHVQTVISNENKKPRGCKGPSRNLMGSIGETRCPISVDDLIDCLKALSIKSKGKEIVGEEQGALVPYKPHGAIVPYEEFDLTKKRRPRPKVDLDPETNRLWNLLMGKEGSESTERTHKDKEKWWEEERNVFRGRVDSFIARMHLVQGDRRFSKWKGSVVDSVIGVFLTQNVSDHLSSSAFMSLAAKFHLKPKIIGQACCQNGGSPSFKKREIQITYPDGDITCEHMITGQPANNHSSVTSRESYQCRSGNVMTETRTFPMDKQTRRVDEDVVSSQSSSESLVFQTNEDIRSSSGSNSEAEDQLSGCNLSKNCGTLNLFEQAERMAAFQEYQCQTAGNVSPNKKFLQSENHLHNMQNQGLDGGSKAYAYPFTFYDLHHQRPAPPSTNSWLSMTNGLEEWEANFLASPGKESISSLASTDFENPKATNVEHAQYDVGQSLERSFISQQTGRPDLSAKANLTIQNKCIEQQNNVPAGFQSKEAQQSISCQRESHKTIQQESNSLSDSRRSAVYNEMPTDNFQHLENKLAETNAVRQGNSSTKPTSQAGPTTSNAKKTQADKEKTEAYNWDELRKQAELKVGKRERSEGTMDSLDYEALRKADVREISETIKERGMNNMLAERIKDFLNRLVKEHGGIDLEWLRDVPPEKAKDYLLSVRGLGLKSVECVRLLTLHNLAFPVDTNVGRIAVRLGWVPLQPLPEELQLHLLELYPVLESIQKYLWPRLCKLDQKTLYELHYQMITFGKVFCTKKQPNCNACPMRGECRHFASAFASARLALPGPEEKGIVPSTAPTTGNKHPGVVIKPMALPTAVDNSDKEMGLNMKNCEPIIEEPTTPEQPVEVFESDIEDAFYEDPDEIPTIKLNIEQFATNLQSVMQEQNKDMQETDLSKALVALNTEFASIPTPKLKSVSRLRTEHQVYELPDHHPLLKGMERREADDPSPYLLAIWTPGETADSVQPPEIKCSHQESGGLCDKKMCFLCNSVREEQTQTVRGTLLIPCRTAMRGSFPLNGTYFQVNEVFADHESSLNPINVPRSILWNLPRRTVFFGTSVTTIFKGLTTEGIQYCFWKGFVCVRGFEQKTRAPRPLVARLHYPASKLVKKNEKK